MVRHVKELPSKADLHAAFSYHEETFVRRGFKCVGGLKKKPAPYIKTERIVGGIESDLGYLRIVLPNRKGTFSLNRVVWAYHNGPVPPGMVVDHINRNPSDNRIENLRAVPDRTNQMNRGSSRKGSAVPYIGVTVSGKKFNAFCSEDGAPIFLGCYATAEVAAVVRDREVLRRHGFQATLNCHLFGFGTEMLYGH